MQQENSSCDVSFRVARELISSDSNIGIVISGKAPCAQELEMSTRKLGRNRVLPGCHPGQHHETWLAPNDYTTAENGPAEIDYEDPTGERSKPRTL